MLLNAIRRFLTRYLLIEEEKEKNIKENERNFIKFLYIEDLWDNEINSNENQKESELKNIENMKISINQIISVYDHYGGDNIINDEINELKEKDDISNQLLFNQEKEIKSDETNPEQNYNDDLEDDNNNSESESNSYANNDDDERE